jgi:hypothetical protein
VRITAGTLAGFIDREQGICSSNYVKFTPTGARTVALFSDEICMEYLFGWCGDLTYRPAARYGDAMAANDILASARRHQR